MNLYRKVMHHALQEGLSPENVAHLPTPIGSTQGTQVVPSELFFELHEIVDQHLKPGCSVRVGQKMIMEDYGVLGLSWKTCSWVGEMFARSERYFKLLSDTYVFQVEKADDISHIHLHRDNYRRGIELSNEATFSATVVVLKAITESDIAPVSVSFKHDIPKEMGSYHEAFNCPVLFNQPSYFISYRTVDLEMPTAKADKSLNQFLVERVEEEVKGIEVKADKLVNDVKTLIKDALPSGIPNITHIGKQLGMSNRTLTRRLSRNGITYRDLIQRTQIEISTDLLKNTSQTVGEIAFLTGFSEQSAFNRAFKRWTGQTPILYRKN